MLKRSWGYWAIGLLCCSCASLPTATESSASGNVASEPKSEAQAASPASSAPAALPSGAPAPSALPSLAAPAPQFVDSGLADLNPDNDTWVAPPEPLVDCEQKLMQVGVEFQAISFPLTQRRGDVFTCGAEQAVIYKRGPEGLRYNARPHVTCRVALGLARFEQLAQQLAREHLGTTIRRVVQLGTYSCRKMARFTNMVSEHSYGNAIDIQSFELSDGRKVSILKHFGDLAQPAATPQARFLRQLARKLYAEDVFSVVLTPYFDALHRDHLHLDQARYRLDGTGAAE